MMWYQELCIYAACGVLTACAMKESLKDGDAGWREMILFAILWPFFAFMLAVVLVIKIFDKDK